MSQVYLDRTKTGLLQVSAVENYYISTCSLCALVHSLKCMTDLSNDVHLRLVNDQLSDH